MFGFLRTVVLNSSEVTLQLDPTVDDSNSSTWPQYCEKSFCFHQQSGAANCAAEYTFTFLHDIVDPELGVACWLHAEESWYGDRAGAALGRGETVHR